MLAVIDTNVLLSGLLWRGAPHILIQQVRAGTLTLVISPALLTELADVIHRPKFRPILTRTGTHPNHLLTEVVRLAELVDAPPLPAPVSVDPDDDHVIAAALAARTELIVSGDRHLLDLGNYQGIRIVTPAEALRLIAIP